MSARSKQAGPLRTLRQSQDATVGVRSVWLRRDGHGLGDGEWQMPARVGVWASSGQLNCDQINELGPEDI